MASSMKLMDAARHLHRSSRVVVKLTCPGAVGSHLARTPALSCRLQPPRLYTTTRSLQKTCADVPLHFPVNTAMTLGCRLNARLQRWTRVGSVVRFPDSLLSPTSGAYTLQARHFGSRSSSAGFSGEDGGDSTGSGGEESGGDGGAYSGPQMTALTPMMVPEVFPNVPLIAVSRNPVFPRFIKIIEVRLM